MLYIASPAKKFPAQQPGRPTIMTNHDDSLFNEGYDSDCNLPYFDAVADMGEDPDNYDEDIILATAPPPESTTMTTATATATAGTASAAGPTAAATAATTDVAARLLRQPDRPDRAAARRRHRWHVRTVGPRQPDRRHRQPVRPHAALPDGPDAASLGPAASRRAAAATAV